MFNTNRDRIVEFLLECKPGPPKTQGTWSVDHDGNPFILPSIGGITLNVQVGDPATGWAGDHVEPGVSCTADTLKPFEHPNTSLQIYACVGNQVKIKSGRAKDSFGYVVGKHGGSEHIIVEFARSIKEELSYDDTICIYARGQGLLLKDFPDIAVFNLDPDLLEKMKLRVTPKKRLQFPVTTIVPAVCLGSGIGAQHVAKGDYDIVTSDKETVSKYQLDKIRLGDFVALQDHDNRYGRAYRQGAITIGIVVHSDCLRAGHGPGVTTIMTCKTDLIEPIIDPKANIGNLI